MHLYKKEYLKAYGAFKQAWHLDVSNQELVKACQDAYELLSGRDRDKTGKAQLRSQADASGSARASTASVASAAVHAAAAEQTEKAARAVRGGEGGGSEAEGTGGGTALHATAPPAAAAAPPAAAATPAQHSLIK